MVLQLIGVSRYLFQKNCGQSGFQSAQNCQKIIVNYHSRHFFSGRNLNNRFRNLLPAFKSGTLFLLLAEEFRQVQAKLRHGSTTLVKNCVTQCEFVIAYRIRRGQQIISLYSKLWDEVALKQFVNRIRKQFVRRGKDFLLGVAAVSAFNWEKERIPDDELTKHAEEIDICYQLRKNNERQDDEDDENGQNSCDERLCAWEAFIIEGDLTAWKKEDPDRKGSGLYCYKVYGRYDDVTANDFLMVFLDTSNRKDWDTHVVSLYVIDSDPSSNSDVIYWEAKWPKLFNNRDYVYKRRYKIDPEKKIMTIVNQSTQHPSVPVYCNKTRVNEYWSHMVIQPFTDFDKPGIEFSLTYFDNPGATLPNAISSWVSTHGMPGYLGELRQAALNLAGQRAQDSPRELNEEAEDGDVGRGDDPGMRTPPSDPPKVTPTQNLPQSPPSHANPLAYITSYVYWATSFLF